MEENLENMPAEFPKVTERSQSTIGERASILQKEHEAIPATMNIFQFFQRESEDSKFLGKAKKTP